MWYRDLRQLLVAPFHSVIYGCSITIEPGSRVWGERMTHHVAAASQSDSLSYFRRLWRILTAADTDLGSKLEQLLANEADEFDMEYGFFSSIDLEEEIQRFNVVHGDAGVIESGTTVPLSTSYCRETITETDGVLAINDALREGWENDPAFRKLGFRSYLGATVSVDDVLYGTLCFANPAPRSDTFVDAERALIDMHTQWVSYELGKWDGPPTHSQVTEVSDEPRMSETQVDSMMDALRKLERRQILLAILDTDKPVRAGDLATEVDSVATEIRLHHLHLPKLNSVGYIEWDPDTQTVTRGPQFDDIEPLLQLLNEYVEGHP